jgi:hypothetical protein
MSDNAARAPATACSSALTAHARKLRSRRDVTRHTGRLMARRPARDYQQEGRVARLGAGVHEVLQALSPLLLTRAREYSERSYYAVRRARR